MDIVKKIEDLTEEIRFKSNINNILCENVRRQDGKPRKYIFIKLDDIEQLVVFKHRSVKYGYVSNIGNDMIGRIEEVNEYPFYISLKLGVRSNMYSTPYAFTVSLYNQEFIDMSNSYYDIEIIDIKELLYEWIS